MNESASATAERLLGQIDAALGDGYDAVLYGSAVRGGFRPGQSDLNLLLIVGSLTLERIEHLGPALTAHERAGHTPPLLFTREEWLRAADAFPIEITDMGLAYRTLRGSDPLIGLEVTRPDLRRALERELRGKVLRLRQGYAVLRSDPAGLGVLAHHALRPLRLIARCLLALHRQVVPEAPGDVLAAAAVAVGVDGEGWVALERSHGALPGPCLPAPFAHCMRATEAVTAALDSLHFGDL